MLVNRLMDDWLESLARNLAQNIVALRERRGLSQAALAKLSQIPRSTIAHIESGSGNPSLANLSRLSAALQVSVEELLSRARPRCELIKAASVKVVKRSQGVAVISKLLPDPVPGMEIDRIEIEKGGRLGGVPHTPGTREYMTCVKGEVAVTVAGERFKVEEGDVLAFPGDQAHSYQNTGPGKAIVFSVVALAFEQ
jgi:XRE family transcriptional regulator, regulator of sulfur utilization